MVVSIVSRTHQNSRYGIPLKLNVKHPILGSHLEWRGKLNDVCCPINSTADTMGRRTFEVDAPSPIPRWPWFPTSIGC